MILIFTFILGFTFGAFSPILTDLSAMLLENIDDARAARRARIKEVQR